MSTVPIIRNTAIISLLLGALALRCGQESPTAPESGITILPALTDSIPYDRLAKGKLVFERVQTNSSGTYIVDIDHRVSWGVRAHQINGPSVSPDGSTIAFASPTGNFHEHSIDLLDIAGSNRRRIFVEASGWAYSPCWSFDGTQIMFYMIPYPLTTTRILPLLRQSPISDPRDRVQIIDLGKIDPPRYLRPDNPISASSVGKLVVSAGGIRSFNVDGTNLRRLATDTNAFSPAWSPDARHIAYLSLQRRFDFDLGRFLIIIFDTETNSVDTLATLSAIGYTNWAGDNRHSLCWSPDGSQIAFNKPDDPDGGSHVYVIRKDGSALSRVTNSKGCTDRSLSWSH
jgi:Tol biopolymer transport system component